MPGCIWKTRAKFAHECRPGGPAAWPDTGELEICKGERECDYCNRDPFNNASLLRSHVHSIHVPEKPGLSVLKVSPSTLSRSRSRDHSKRSQIARNLSRGVGGRFSGKVSVDDEKDASGPRGRKRTRSETPAPDKRATRRKNRDPLLSTAAAELNLDATENELSAVPNDLSEQEDPSPETAEEDQDDEEIIPRKPPLKLFLKNSQSSKPAASKKNHVRFVAPTGRKRPSEMVTEDGEDMEDLRRQLEDNEDEQERLRLKMNRKEIQRKMERLERAKSQGE